MHQINGKLIIARRGWKEICERLARWLGHYYHGESSHSGPNFQGESGEDGLTPTWPDYRHDSMSSFELLERLMDLGDVKFGRHPGRACFLRYYDEHDYRLEARGETTKEALTLLGFHAMTQGDVEEKPHGDEEPAPREGLAGKQDLQGTIDLMYLASEQLDDEELHFAVEDLEGYLQHLYRRIYILRRSSTTRSALRHIEMERTDAEWGRYEKKYIASVADQVLGD